MSRELEGRAALVTGASRGLGKAIAAALAREGAHVGLVDLKQHWVDAAADEIAAAGGSAVGIEADVTQRDRFADAIRRFAHDAGRLDILVNNAMWIRYEALPDITPEGFDRMVGVGLGGVIWGIQAAAPLMTKGGSIVNMGSVAGRVGSASAIVYGTIKAGIDGLTRNASSELGPLGIRVNAVAPSSVMTEGVAAILTPDVLKRRLAATPLGRIAVPEDMAQAVLWLASDRSSFVTGQSIAVDGGLGHHFQR